jgi:hypothetical protein
MAMQQQQDDVMTQYKQNFNVLYTACRAHQMGVVIPLRRCCGPDVLRTPCAFAFVLMCVWAMCTRDNFLWLWIGVWCCYFLKHRLESALIAKSGAKIHSQYDGWPDAIRIGRTEKVAKLIVEPVVIVSFGAVMFYAYQQNHWQPYGLPYFMLTGGFTLPFVEIVKQTIWRRRTQSMLDARVEQEALVNDFRNRFGN